MNNASTADGPGQDVPQDAEPFFPSEGTFNAVVPLSEVGRAPAPLPPVDAAAAESAWARDGHRAALKEEEEETTLVPARRGGARGTTVPGARRSRVFPAAVIALSITAGLASGSYFIWSSQRAPAAQQTAPSDAATRVEAEAPTLQPANAATPAPVVEEVEADAKAGRADEAAKAEKAGEVVKAEKSPEPARVAPTPRAARPARAAAAEVREVTPAPKPARSQSAPTPRPRVTTAERRPPRPTARTLPISSPPPSAKSKKVIQWP
jgi:hypothetical protein